MLGLLVIVNSLYKGIQWYNSDTASNVATYGYTIAIGRIIAINKGPYGTIAICVSLGISNGKPRSLPSIDG